MAALPVGVDLGGASGVGLDEHAERRARGCRAGARRRRRAGPSARRASTVASSHRPCSTSIIARWARPTLATIGRSSGSVGALAEPRAASASSPSHERGGAEREARQRVALAEAGVVVHVRASAAISAGDSGAMIIRARRRAAPARPDPGHRAGWRSGSAGHGAVQPLHGAARLAVARTGWASGHDHQAADGATSSSVGNMRQPALDRRETAGGGDRVPNQAGPATRPARGRRCGWRGLIAPVGVAVGIAPLAGPAVDLGSPGGIAAVRSSACRNSVMRWWKRYHSRRSSSGMTSRFCRCGALEQVRRAGALQERRRRGGRRCARGRTRRSGRRRCRDRGRRTAPRRGSRRGSDDRR